MTLGCGAGNAPGGESRGPAAGSATVTESAATPVLVIPPPTPTQAYGTHCSPGPIARPLCGQRAAALAAAPTRDGGSAASVTVSPAPDFGSYA